MGSPESLESAKPPKATKSSAALSRRVRQTRDQLETAFGALIDQKQYDDIRIEDVTERAGIARTTFYLHYTSKDDLFLSWAQRNMLDVDFGLIRREQWLADEPSPQFIALFQMAQRGRTQRILAFSTSKDALVLMRGMENLIVGQIKDRLHTAFDETQSQIPFAVLAQAIAGTLMRLISWRVETRTATAEESARFAQQIIRAIIRTALRL